MRQKTAISTEQCALRTHSAVTAACMMTKAEVFRQAGGFTEELAVAFNDIDYCMKVRALGKLVVYAPYAVMHHYESKSRGLEDTPEKVARFNREVLFLPAGGRYSEKRRSLLQSEPDASQIKFCSAGSAEGKDWRAL